MIWTRHGLLTRPKSPMASPERRGWAARRDQRRPGSSGARTRRGAMDMKHSARAELRAPRRASGGSAGHTRRRGKAHQAASPRQWPVSRHARQIARETRRPSMRHAIVTAGRDPNAGLGVAKRRRARSRPPAARGAEELNYKVMHHCEEAIRMPQSRPRAPLPQSSAPGRDGCPSSIAPARHRFGDPRPGSRAIPPASRYPHPPRRAARRR